MSLNHSLKAGVRFDYYTKLASDSHVHDDDHGHDHDHEHGHHNNDHTEYAFVPTLTYEASEFASFKLAYTHSVKTEDNKTTNDQSLQLQTVFILGAHPAHDF